MKTPTPIIDYTKLMTPFEALKVTLKKWPIERVIADYVGRMAFRYKKAQMKLEEEGIPTSPYTVRMFVKSDKETGELKPGRAINARIPERALLMAQYTKPLEAWFYKLEDWTGSRVVGKCDMYTLAGMIETKWNSFANPVAIMLDASKFDTCVPIEFLRAYAKSISRKFPHESRTILALWKCTYVNRGVSSKGVKFKTSGTRMSGDMDTGFGNSVLMWLLLTEWIRIHEVKASILVNGDDSVVFCERKDLPKLRNLQFFKDAGFNMKFEHTDVFSHVEFCQARPVETDYGLAMARNPYRALARFGWGTVRRKNLRDFAYTLGQCEMASSKGVPVLGPLAEHLVARFKGKLKFENSWQMETYRNRNKLVHELKPTYSTRTRQSYEEAWGVPIWQQLEIEGAFDAVAGHLPDMDQIIHLQEISGVYGN